MNQLPWFPCYPSKLLGALAGMKPDEGYVYWIVCLRIYETGHACRDTLDALARRTGMSRRRVSDALDLSFGAGRLTREDDGIMNPFAAGILKEAIAFRESRVRAGKKGAASTWEKHKEKQQITNGTAIAEPSASDGNSMANDGHLHLHLQIQEEEKKDSRAVARATRPRPDDLFEEFWKVYPRREGANPKSPAEKVFRAFVASGVDPRSIISGARGCAEKEKGKIGTPYIPQAIKWLRDRRWEDYNAEPEKPRVVAGFYAESESLELVKWDAHHRATTGRNAPRDRNGGWRFPTQWPPGYVPESNDELQLENRS